MERVTKKIEKKFEPVITENNASRTEQEKPRILGEIVIEELSIDGICGVY